MPSRNPANKALPDAKKLSKSPSASKWSPLAQDVLKALGLPKRYTSTHPLLGDMKKALRDRTTKRNK